jgi:hypothetical protein
MFPLELPLHEVAFVAAVDQQMIDATAGRPATGFQIALLETKHGPLLRFQITLAVSPTDPVQMRVAVNPDQAREWVVELAGQDTFQILFFDAYTGAGLGRRVLPLDTEQREALQTILEATAGMTISPEQWRDVVMAAAEYI